MKTCTHAFLRDQVKLQEVDKLQKKAKNNKLTDHTAISSDVTIMKNIFSWFDMSLNSMPIFLILGENGTGKEHR
jgi:transcriptional regulator with GAF, ATPase, and Fis domain